MPKTTKCRKVNGMPGQFGFSPTDSIDMENALQLTFDEFETIRLLDADGLTQEQCAKQMGVARTTVTSMYNSARKKIASMLVDGRSLIISGGNVEFTIAKDKYIQFKRQKGANEMRIAVTYDNGNIFQHFGHTEKFKIYDIEEKKIVNEEIVDTNGQGHGALAGFLVSGNVDILICGGIGGGAKNALAEAGITLFGGVTGSADDAVAAYLEDKLNYNPNVACSHHDEKHGEGHSCSDHGHHENGHSCGGHCHE